VDYAAVVIIEIVSSIASLVLISIGLAVIFGMMGIINLAHGEFLMLGGYAVILGVKCGVNIWVSMLIVAPAVVGLIGVVIERLIIRRLSGRVVDTMLATWGLSLFLVGLVTTILGNTTEGISAPLGAVTIGSYKVSIYTMFIVAVAIGVMLIAFVLLKKTNIGLLVRGTMQDTNMAAALGVRTSRIYAATFGVGAALGGLAGAILAPITGIVPTIGVVYVAKAFITVIGGGSAVLAGTLSASVLFGSINQAVSFATTPVVGEVALFGAAIVLIRLMPRGITGRFFRRAL
jgi:branched-subunit amino acid ABC-type transport system permease component